MMRPIDFAGIINATRKATHYALSGITVLFALGTLLCGAALGTGHTSLGLNVGLICVFGLIGTIAIGGKLQERGILEDPSKY